MALSKDEFMLRQQDKRNEMIDDAVSAAQARFAANQKHYMRIDPGRFSHVQQREFLRDERTRGLQEHELDMVREKGKADLAIEQVRAEGQKNAGAVAAQARAGAEVDVSKNSLEAEKYKSDAQKAIEAGRDSTRLTETEKKLASEQALEKIRGANSAAVEDARGDWAHRTAVDTQSEKNKGVKMELDARVLAEERAHRNALELQAEKNLGRRPSDAEVALFSKLRNKPENKGKTAAELWSMISIGSAE